MTIKFSLSSDPAESSASPCVVVGVFEERVLSAAAARIDEKSGGAIKRLIEAGDVNGKPGTSQLLFGVANVTAPRVLVVGLGEQKKFDAARFQRACGTLLSLQVPLRIRCVGARWLRLGVLPASHDATLT